MENPCLTFVTPSLLAGDRSLADVVAHEIAHSWTGNLVTAANWEHFWLNEGWTVWLERKIGVEMHGGDERYYDFSALLNYPHLKNDVKFHTDKGSRRLTALVPELGPVDPDEVRCRCCRRRTVPSFSTPPHLTPHPTLPVPGLLLRPVREGLGHAPHYGEGGGV